MRQYLLYGIRMIIAGVISTAILSSFSLAYYYTGVRIQNPSGATDYTWEPNQWRAIMTEGFSWFHMDENGYNNAAFSPDEKIDILLAGSSHMEAIEVLADENTGYLLNQILPELYTYNIGMSGHEIYSCINNMENAVEVFQPEKYVVLETGSVNLFTDDMEKVTAGKYLPLPSYDSRILYLFQKKVPVVKLLHRQLEAWLETTDRNEQDDKIKETDYCSGEYKDTLNEFLKMAVAPVRECGARLIIFYHPHTSLSENGDLFFDTDANALSAFESSCKESGILFVNLTEDYASLYEEQHALPYGFINTEVGKGHLNRYGHQVIAKRLRDEILLQEEKNKRGIGDVIY